MWAFLLLVLKSPRTLPPYYLPAYLPTPASLSFSVLLTYLPSSLPVLHIPALVPLRCLLSHLPPYLLPFPIQRPSLFPASLPFPNLKAFPFPATLLIPCLSIDLLSFSLPCLPRPANSTPAYCILPLCSLFQTLSAFSYPASLLTTFSYSFQNFRANLLLPCHPPCHSTILSSPCQTLLPSQSASTLSIFSYSANISSPRLCPFHQRSSILPLSALPYGANMSLLSQQCITFLHPFHVSTCDYF